VQEVYDSFANVLYENITRVRAGRPLLHTLVLPGGGSSSAAGVSDPAQSLSEDEGQPTVAQQ
jgi:hypothetical protein